MMRAKFINEGIKHLKPRSKEEIIGNIPENISELIRYWKDLPDELEYSNFDAIIYNLIVKKASENEEAKFFIDKLHVLSERGTIDEWITRMEKLGYIFNDNHEIINKINEGIKHLKPRDESEIKKTFEKYGITDNYISIRIRKLEKDYRGYVRSRLERAIDYANVKIYKYNGPVPYEEYESAFQTISGKPWNVLKFANAYYQWGGDSLELSIKKLKTLIINK